MPIYSVSRRRAVALLALTSILLITLDQQGNGIVGGARNVFGFVFHPVEEATRVVTRPIQNAWRGVTNYGELEAENEQLRDRLDQQEGAFIRTSPRRSRSIRARTADYRWEWPWSTPPDWWARSPRCFRIARS